MMMKSTFRFNPRAAAPWFYASPSLLLVCFVVFLPMLVGASYSLQRFSLEDVFSSSTEYAGLLNFSDILADPKLPGVLFNTAWWTLGSLIFQCSLGLSLALLLRHSKDLRWSQAFLFLPWAIPSVLVSMVWKAMLSPTTGPIPNLWVALGIYAEPQNILADPALAMWGPIMANIWAGVPFFAITLLAALQAIPDDFYEAAAIDGASRFQMFTKLTLPLLLPTLLVTMLLRTVWIFNYGDLVWIMTTGGPAGSTQIASTYLYTLAFVDLNDGLASAFAVLQVIFLCGYAAAVLRLRAKLNPVPV